MRIQDISITTPTRTATVELTSKEVILIEDLLQEWMDTEGQRHTDAGFGFATDTVAGMLQDMKGLYDRLWPESPRTSKRVPNDEGCTPECFTFEIPEGTETTHHRLCPNLARITGIQPE